MLFAVMYENYDECCIHSVWQTEPEARAAAAQLASWIQSEDPDTTWRQARVVTFAVGVMPTHHEDGVEREA